MALLVCQRGYSSAQADGRLLTSVREDQRAVITAGHCSEGSVRPQRHSVDYFRVSRLEAHGQTQVNPHEEVGMTEVTYKFANT